MGRGGIILLLYIVVGVIVAAFRDYFQGLGDLTDIFELLVAIIAWPLVLAGVDIDFANGGGGGGGGGGGS